MTISSGLLACLDRAGALRALLRARAHRRSTWLPILLYHRVSDRPGADYPFDRGVIDAMPAAFDEQIAFIARHCTAIGVDDLLAYLDGEPLPPNPVMVTFDDGYRDNVERALPILRRHAVRGTFFIASGYVSDRRVFWWDRISYLFHHSRRDTVELGYPTDLRFDLRRDRRAAQLTALKLVKHCCGLDLERFLRELGDALGVAWPPSLERALASELVMSWDDVRALRDAGMDVGSHTRTHRVLYTVDPGSLVDELGHSKAEIEGAIGASVHALAYPVGRSLRRLAPITAEVERAGYRLGFSVESGPNSLRGPLERFDLMRVPVDVDMSSHRLPALLAAPELV
jgi:peptidoglycan/xylan/chitin deacetylase (PgdA/CDA1 family)